MGFKIHHLWNRDKWGEWFPKFKRKPKTPNPREEFDLHISNQMRALKTLEEKAQILWTRDDGITHKLNLLGIEPRHLVLDYPELHKAQLEYHFAMHGIFTLNEKKKRSVAGINFRDLHEQSMFADAGFLLSLVSFSKEWRRSEEYQQYKLSWLDLSKTIVRAEKAEEKYIEELMDNGFLTKHPFEDGRSDGKESFEW